MNYIPFMKLSGAGNDFVIIDNRDEIVQKNIDSTLSDFVMKVCARRMSVGADGLLLVENSENADFKMRYFNSDGGEAETCGNGARCISKFAYLNGIGSRSRRDFGKKMTFETIAGIYDSEIIGDDVKVRMSDPTDIRLDFGLELKSGEITASFANTGVPHVVFFVDDIKDADIIEIGRETRYHKDFQPAGTNANFVKVKDRHSIRIRTYERGVEDETLACGTGSIASAIIAGLKGKVDSPVKMFTRSGSVLTIHFELHDEVVKDAYIEGDARVIYSGELNEDAWKY